MKKPFYVSFIILALLACGSISDPLPETEEDPFIAPDGDAEYHLLFIGNSLTYSNDLPNLVRNFAYKKDLMIDVTSIALGNYALSDHWEDGDIQTYIKTGNYDYVIVQQGGSSQAYGRSILIEYGGYISDLCKENDAKLAYYMVWPSMAYYDTFEGVIESYTQAAKATNDILCPVGLVWKTYFDETGDFSYYSSDGLHPSLAGSKVAAEVIYDTLFGK